MSQSVNWRYILVYILGVIAIGVILYFIFEKYKDKLPEKYKRSLTFLTVMALYLGVASQSRIVKLVTGQEYVADIIDFLSACFIIIGVFIVILSVKLEEYTDKLTQSTINPLREKIDDLENTLNDAIKDFKKEHIKVYNLRQLEAFTEQDPIFSNKIVKQEGYLHIASLMKDFDVVLSGKLNLRSYEQFFNILHLLATILDDSYDITIIDHVEVTKIPSTMSGGYDLIEEYSAVLDKLKAKVNNCKRIVIVDRDEDTKNENLLILLFSQIDLTSIIYLGTKNQIVDTSGHTIDSKHFTNYTRLLITKKGCDCNSADACVYCYSLKFASPYNGSLSDKLLESELTTLKVNENYSKEFPYYIRLFHKEKKENIEEFEHDKILFSIDFSRITQLYKKTIFNNLSQDKNKFYNLYQEVNAVWAENVELATPNNIYGCDTTILDNEIEDWLNRPFYQYVLKQNATIAKKLKDKKRALKRFFIIDEVRESKIQALIEILNAHIEKGIDVSIVQAQKLPEKSIKYIYDFNYIENVCIFEIAGLRRKYVDNKFKLIVSDKNPTYPCWKKYDKGSDMYTEIAKFTGILSTVAVEITKDNIEKNVKKYISPEISSEQQEEKLKERECKTP